MTIFKKKMQQLLTFNDVHIQSCVVLINLSCDVQHFEKVLGTVDADLTLL